MASLEFASVSKVYDSSVWAVRDLNLSISDGEFVVLVGPSGCGKTTALRMLAGFEDVTAGEIRIAGEPVNNVLPRDRDIAMVFQNYALYPHMKVYDNIGYGLKVRRMPKAERAARIERVAGMLGLTEVLARRPSQLSGGQRQRVAMGRAIVRQPRAFLMDEPLSNLDARLRVRMRTEIAGLQRELGVTTVYVTHDQIEAMTMADRVAVLRGGVLQQFDTPQAVYSNPANLFVASFIGSPGMNLLQARFEQRDGGVACLLGDYSLILPEAVLSAHPELLRRGAAGVALGARPDAVSVAAAGQPGLAGTVVAAEELGSEVVLHIQVQAEPVVHEAVQDGLTDERLEPVTGLDGGASRSAVIVAQLPADAAFRRGDRVAVALDAPKLHFFELEHGVTLRDLPPAPAPAAAPSASAGQRTVEAQA